MPRCRLFLTMTDGTTQQYDVTSYSYAPSGTLLHFTLPDGAVMAILLYWVKSVKVLEIDAAAESKRREYDRSLVQPC